jgi:hypothetical protein
LTRIQHVIHLELRAEEKILNTILEMQRKGYSEPTLKYTLNLLLAMARRVSLDNPQDVMQYVALKKCEIKNQIVLLHK